MEREVADETEADEAREAATVAVEAKKAETVVVAEAEITAVIMVETKVGTSVSRVQRAAMIRNKVRRKRNSC